MGSGRELDVGIPEDGRVIVLEPMRSPYLLPDEAARYLRMSLRTLTNHRNNKTGPTYRKHGGKICYHEDDLDHWSRVHTQ